MAPEDRGTAGERCWFTSSQRHPEGVEPQGGPTARSLAVGCLGHRGGFRAPHHQQGARGAFGQKGSARENRAPRPGVSPGQVTPGVSPPAPGAGGGAELVSEPSPGCTCLGVAGGASTPGSLPRGRPPAFLAVR